MLDLALQLEGLYRNASTHAAGVVIADRPLTELTPLYRDPRSPLPATQFNMKWVESAVLVKFDFLGLKTLTVIHRTVKLLEKARSRAAAGILPLDDPRLTNCCRQVIRSGSFRWKVRCEIRFASSGLRRLRRSRRSSPYIAQDPWIRSTNTSIARWAAARSVSLPNLETALAETYGVIVYQEQVIHRPGPGRLLAGRGRPATPGDGQKEKRGNGPTARRSSWPARSMDYRPAMPRQCSIAWRNSPATASTSATPRPTP